MVRYGEAPFLFLPPPTLGTPREAFPPDYGWELWVTYAVWAAVVGGALSALPVVCATQAAAAATGGSVICRTLPRLRFRQPRYLEPEGHPLGGRDFERLE